MVKGSNTNMYFLLWWVTYIMFGGSIPMFFHHYYNMLGSFG